MDSFKIEPAADEIAHVGATIAMAKEDLAALNVGGDGVAQALPMDAAHAMDPYVGKELGGVKIERVVGSGGMGRVYLGTDLTSGTRVALKVLLRTLRDEDVRKRFDREGRMMESCAILALRPCFARALSRMQMLIFLISSWSMSKGFRLFLITSSVSVLEHAKRLMRFYKRVMRLHLRIARDMSIAISSRRIFLLIAMVG